MGEAEKNDGLDILEPKLTSCLQWHQRETFFNLPYCWRLQSAASHRWSSARGSGRGEGSEAVCLSFSSFTRVNIRAKGQTHVHTYSFLAVQTQTFLQTYMHISEKKRYLQRSTDTHTLKYFTHTHMYMRTDTNKLKHTTHKNNHQKHQWSLYLSLYIHIYTTVLDKLKKYTTQKHFPEYKTVYYS